MLTISEECTVWESACFFPAPRYRAVSTLIPPERPMRKPVNIVTRMVVDPTEPRANGPAKRPTTAISDILKRT